MGKKCSVFFIFYLLSIYSIGQVPGYMGKRFIVGVGNSFAVNLKPLYLLDNPESTYLGPVITNAFNVEYVISERRSLCFSVRQFTRKIDNRYYSTNNYNIVTKGFEKFHLFNYSIGVKRFAKRRIAPLGFYTKWEGYYINGWMDYKSYAVPVSTFNSYELVQYEGGKIKFFGTGGAYSIGKQRIFKDKFVIDYGVRSTVMVVLFDSANAYEKKLGLYASDVSIFSLLNFNINIGFLAF